MKKLALYLLLLPFLACTSKQYKASKITGKRISIDTTHSGDQTIEDFVTPHREELQKTMEKALSTAPIDFVKNDGTMQSTLGNLMADLCYEMANPVFKEKKGLDLDFVLMNHGGLRAPIPKGVVRTENAFLLMPFENEMVVTKLSGAKVKELFDYFVSRERAHPISKQVQLTIKGEDYSVKINGKPFDENKTYYVLTNDYLQTGCSGMTFFANPEELIGLDYKVREAIIDYFTKEKTLQAAIDNRVIVTQ